MSKNKNNKPKADKAKLVEDTTIVAPVEVVEAVVPELVVESTPDVLEAAPVLVTDKADDTEDKVEVDEEVTADEIEMIEAIALAAAPDVGTNASLIVFPSDPYGLTKDLKVAIQRVASRIAGHADKKALVNAVLIKAIAHIKVKFDSDVKIREARLQEAAEQVAE